MKRVRSLLLHEEVEREIIILQEKTKADRTTFKLILPFLFPGYYSWDTRLAFRTYLALAGVCRVLRYWNLLRRWIGWTSPVEIRENLRSHSFTSPLWGDDYLNYTKIVEKQLRSYIVGDVPVRFTSQWIASALSMDEVWNSNFEIDLNDIPFWDCVEARMENSIILCFRVTSFSELVLLMYAILKHDVDEQNGWCIITDWKAEKESQKTLFFWEFDKERYFTRSALGKMLKRGQYAPQEKGFTNGSLPVSSYIWFDKWCNTSGSRKKLTCEERLEKFVLGWFPSKLFPEKICNVKSRKDINTEIRAYEFGIEFN